MRLHRPSWERSDTGKPGGLGWRDAPGGVLLSESFQKQLKFCLCCRSARLGVTCPKGSASTLLVPCLFPRDPGLFGTLVLFSLWPGEEWEL